MSELKVRAFKPSDKLADKYSKKFSKLIGELAIDVAEEVKRAGIGIDLAPFVHRDVMMKFLLDIIVQVWDYLVEAQTRTALEAKRRGLAE